MRQHRYILTRGPFYNLLLCFTFCSLKLKFTLALYVPVFPMVKNRCSKKNYDCAWTPNNIQVCNRHIFATVIEHLFHSLPSPNLSLTALVLVAALQCRVCVSDVLSAVAPFRAGHKSCAGMSVPGAVGVSRQAALSTGFTIHAAAMQRNLCYTSTRAHKQ